MEQQVTFFGRKIMKKTFLLAMKELRVTESS